MVDKVIFHPQMVSANGGSDLPSSIKEAWIMLHQWYVDGKAIDDCKIVDGIISGMLKAVGDEGHTRYLNSAQLARYQSGLAGEYVGIGIELAERNKQIVIVASMDQSPAQKAGIHAGDILIGVNGHDVQNQTLEQIVDLVRGPEGSSVDLCYEKPGRSDRFNIKLKRESVQTRSVVWTMLPGNIADIRLNQFAYGSADQVGEAVKRIQAAGASAIVFDLRNNPGGLVSEAVGVSSIFLPENAPVFVSQFQDGHQKINRAYYDENSTSIPVVILVNQRTASSSEIVAGALQDNKRAKIVGEKTYGTGTLLNQFRLSNGGAVLIGTEFWLTPSKKPIRGQGVMPDFPIKLETGKEFIPGAPTAAENDIQGDAQLLQALRMVHHNFKPEPYTRSAALP
jgi:carboxyl-terminal processing protease